MATIRKIKNSKKGAYQIIVSNGYDSNNKQIRVTTTFTPDKTKSQRQQEKQVQEFAIDFERQVKTGRVYSGDKISFADFVKEWEEKEAKQNLEETTLYSYKGHLKNVILPAIGKYKMSKVTPAILEQFYRSLTKDNAKKDGKGSYKIASIKKFHKIISGIMRTAVRWNVIEENPCDKAELPRERNKSNDVKHFTLEQAMTFLEAMDKPYSVPFKGHKITVPSGKVIELDTYIKERMLPIQFKIFYRLSLFGGLRKGDADGKISLNQQKPSKHAGLRRFGPEKFLQRNNEFMKERPIFYKKPIKTEKDFSTWLRCFYYTTKAVITEYTYF